MRGKHPGENRFDFIAGIAALLLIIAAWFIGNSRAGKDLMPLIESVTGEFEIVSEISSTSWIAVNTRDTLLVATGKGQGYGGGLSIVVMISPAGVIKQVSIVENRETPSFMRKVARRDYFDQFEGLLCNETYYDQVDIVSGSTMTSEGIIAAVESASHSLAQEYLGIQVPPEEEEGIIAGLREISWLALIALAYITSGIRWRPKLLKWSVMILALVIIGFKLNSPLSISLVNKGLLGYWPDWHTHLYFYIIIFGLLLLVLLTGKNHYCDRICPFGTTQEIIAGVTGAGKRFPGRFRKSLLWLQRILALGLIITALLIRNPGAINYEVFGAMFRLTGTTLQFILLIIVAILSVFIRRPWCGYMCPLRPVNDYVRFFRNEGFRRIRNQEPSMQR